MHIGNPSSSPGRAGTFQIDPLAADIWCRSAVLCLANDDPETAAGQLIKALCYRPSFALAFKLLGDCYAARGEAANAALCYRNKLPEGLIGGSLRDYPAINRSEFSQTTVFDSEQCTALAPGKIVEHSAFGETSLLSNACFVDTISDATLWHDDLNTQVKTRSGSVLSHHTVGCDSLMHKIQTRYQPVKINGRAILLGAKGAHNYYHWTTDIAPKLILLKEAGYKLHDSDRFIVSRAEAGFAKTLLAMFNVPLDKVISTEMNSPFLEAEELIVPYLNNKMGYGMGKWLPRRMQEVLGVDKIQKQDRRLFINRKPETAAGRTLANSRAAEDFLTGWGFDVVYPETLTIREQAALFATADVVVGIHGAGLSNIIYCKPGTRVIEFYGAHIAPCYWLISAISGFRYYQHPCFAAYDTNASRHSAGLSLPLAEAEQLLVHADVKKQRSLSRCPKHLASLGRVFQRTRSRLQHHLRC